MVWAECDLIGVARKYRARPLRSFESDLDRLSHFLIHVLNGSRNGESSLTAILAYFSLLDLS